MGQFCTLVMFIMDLWAIIYLGSSSEFLRPTYTMKMNMDDGVAKLLEIFFTFKHLGTPGFGKMDEFPIKKTIVADLWNFSGNFYQRSFY